MPLLEKPELRRCPMIMEVYSEEEAVRVLDNDRRIRVVLIPRGGHLDGGGEEKEFCLVYARTAVIPIYLEQHGLADPIVEPPAGAGHRTVLFGCRINESVRTARGIIIRAINEINGRIGADRALLRR